MQETPETLLERTSVLLESLAIILQRNIDTLQKRPPPVTPASNKAGNKASKGFITGDGRSKGKTPELP